MTEPKKVKSESKERKMKLSHFTKVRFDCTNVGPAVTKIAVNVV